MNEEREKESRFKKKVQPKKNFKKKMKLFVLLFFVLLGTTLVFCQGNTENCNGPACFWRRLEEKRDIWKRNVLSVYNLTIFPYNEHYILGGQLPNVLNTEICGRVHPFGIHCGVIGVAEYFYGLTPNRITFEQLPPVVIKRVEMTQFIADLFQRKAYSNINYIIASSRTGDIVSNATQGLFFFSRK